VPALRLKIQLGFALERLRDRWDQYRHLGRQRKVFRLMEQETGRE
jgi:hypothetical protein